MLNETVIAMKYEEVIRKTLERLLLTLWRDLNDGSIIKIQTQINFQ